MSKRKIIQRILASCTSILGYFLIIHYYDWKLAVAIALIVAGYFTEELIKRSE